MNWIIWKKKKKEKEKKVREKKAGMKGNGRLVMKKRPLHMPHVLVTLALVMENNMPSATSSQIVLYMLHNL